MLGLPYSVPLYSSTLSAATHGRLTQSGTSDSILTGRTEVGVQIRAIHSSAETSAKVTVLAAIAARTHLRALALYANEPEELVMAAWLARSRSGAREVPD